MDLSNFVWDDPDTTNQDVSEVFALPIGLKPVAKLDTTILYSSARLEQTFIKALSKSSRTQGAISKFVTLTTDKKKIIPCFITKGMPGFIGWKIFAPSSVKSIMGFYMPKTDKIYVLISNNVNMFGHVSNNFLAELTVHECMHMLANKLKTGFINLYSNEITTYYTILWSKIFNFDPKELPPAKVKPIILFLSKIEAASGKVSNADLVNYHTMLKKTLKGISKLDSTQFEKMLNDYIVIIKIYTTNVSAFFQSIRQFIHILSPMYGTYKEAFALTNLTTICIQELLYPSEIIAILSEDRRHIKKSLQGIMKL